MSSLDMKKVDSRLDALLLMAKEEEIFVSKHSIEHFKKFISMDGKSLQPFIIITRDGNVRAEWDDDGFSDGNIFGMEFLDNGDVRLYMFRFIM